MRGQERERRGRDPRHRIAARTSGLRRKTELHGKVLVVGGGNTAIDCARTALRSGAQEVTILYRRTRTEMPANAMEIEEAEHEGVKIEYLVAPTQVISRDERLLALECQRMELGAPDASGRRSPKPVPGSEYQIPCDFVLAAIGQNTTMATACRCQDCQFPPGRRVAQADPVGYGAGRQQHLRDLG